MEKAKCVVCGKVLGPKDRAFWVTRLMGWDHPMLSPCCCMEEAEQLKAQDVAKLQAKIDQINGYPIESTLVCEIGNN